MKKTRNRFQKIARKFWSHPRNYLWLIIDNLWITINKYVAVRGGVVVFNSTFESHKPENNKIFNLIRSLKKESIQLQSDFELLYLYSIINKTKKIDGDVAEVGVYRGSSAKIICETTKKRVYLFDTFGGLPEPGSEDVPNGLKKGDYKASYDETKIYLRKYKNCTLYKGIFPSTSKPIKNRKFSLVHLDTDLYKSTLKCLSFFYTRMSKGGVIICHDYHALRGVKNAVDKFFKNKPEIVVESLAGSSQCLIIKL